MKIILGSVNKDKIEIVKKAFAELHLDVAVEGIKVNPEIENQPLNKVATQKGSENRAKNANIYQPNANFWIGLEGGLHDYGEGYHLVTFATLIDKKGDYFTGTGEEIHLPKTASKRVKKGEWFGAVIREYAKDHDIDQNLITRISPFTNAVQNAYANYLKAKGNLTYRKKANGIVVNSKNQILLVQLINYDENQWNTPGGGIEKNETSSDAMKRELKEELGTDKFELLEVSNIKNVYHFPDFVIANGLREGKKYKGQEQTQFILKFIGEDSDIKIQEEEIKKYIWVSFKDLETYLIFPGQAENIKKVILSSEKAKIIV